ncbi:MAG: DUF1801 domain-containing protein [Phycisphaeraceae bacterium]|nr:DUF1801 domain-containing protein [Phycisphaeraceae bacterium]
MSVKDQISAYINSQPEPKRGDMHELHRRAIRISPACRLSFFDGKDERGRTVSNPTIGYGSHTMRHADGTTKDVFRIGISANATGISVYVLGIDDKAFLKKKFAAKLGKASVTGYCIRFKSLTDVDVDVLEDVIRFGLGKRVDVGGRPTREKSAAGARTKLAKPPLSARKK